jgi:DNA-binding MarR family transcriptional regulator
MSDLDAFLQLLPRINAACASRRAHGVGSDHPDLTEHQVRILGLLDDVDPAMVTELAEHMGVTPSTMSLTLKRLRDTGYVTSERDPADRRVMNVRLTEQGLRARDAAAGLDPDRVDALLGRLGPEGRQRALLGLRLLADAAEAQ